MDNKEEDKNLKSDDKKQKFLNKKTKPKTQVKNETTFFKDEHDIDDLMEEQENENDEKINTFSLTQNDNTLQNKLWINKTRTLIVSSRGISHQERHLVNNLLGIIPNAKKECKIEREIAKDELCEICYNHNCKYCLYFEHRKRELVLWMFKSPDGPCAKFQVRNIHVLNEIKLLGNCIKYSRPLLSFDKSFELQPHLKLIKEMLIQTFNSPRGHPKTKPFYDHVISFFNVNNQIFFRNYQILNELKEKFTNSDKEDKLNLLEIGPRFSLNLIRIFENSLGGKTLYLNKLYIPPSALIKKKMENYKKRNIKEIQEKIALDDKIKNIKENKQKWLDEDDDED